MLRFPNERHTLSKRPYIYVSKQYFTNHQPHRFRAPVSRKVGVISGHSVSAGFEVRKSNCPKLLPLGRWSISAYQPLTNQPD